jgi:alpha-1,2-mannosyltransferase
MSGHGVAGQGRGAAGRLVVFLRDAAWLSADRAQAYVRVLAVMLAIVAVGWVVLSRDGVTIAGFPLGSDFVSFWAASGLALDGRPEAAYDPAAHYAVQRTAVPATDESYYAFLYPPVFLLVCLPLAALPYLWSLTIWLGVTGLAYWRCLRALLPQRWAALPILAYPAVLMNAGHGQNGFLSTACFGAAMLALDRRPVLAGLAFGGLVFKPHLAVVVPFALAASGRWRTLIAAALSASALCLLSWLVFGGETWRGFLAQTALARAVLEQDLVGPAKMVSTFAAIRLLGGGVAAAYAAQVAVGLALCGVLWGIRRARPAGLALGALMVAMAVLASPFLLDYDLVLLALPMAWLMASAQRTGFRPWEKTVLFMGFIAPLFIRTISLRLGIPLGPPVLATLLVVVASRALSPSSRSASSCASPC